MTTTTNPADIDPTKHADIVNRNILSIGKKQDPTGSRLTEADAEQLRDHLPDDPIRLPKGKIACAGCGQATDYPRTRAAIIRVPTFAAKANGKVGRHTGYVLLARCPACQDRRQLALMIAGSHPKASEQLGNVVIDAVEHVLVALTVLGKPLPDVDCTDAELASLIRAFGSVGGSATWQFIAAERSGQCSPRPWGHVRQDTRTTLTRSWFDHYAETLKMRRPPVQVPPPRATGSASIKINDGCLLCGIDHVDVPALRVHRLGGPAGAAQDVWRQVESIAPASLGGPAMVDRLSGSVCPTCAKAVSSVGGVGESAMEIALARHLEGLGDEGTAQVIRAGERLVVGWGGLVARARQHGEPDPEPNTTPWGHLTLDVPRSGATSSPADHHTDPTLLEAL